MNLQSTDFELFDVPARFAQDPARLDTRWKELQRQLHPDKFVREGAAAQRVAAQWSARVNEAYGRLKDPLKRAAYLCELNGAPIEAESNTAMPPAFLMQQMAWREALDEAHHADAVAALKHEVHAARDDALKQLQTLLDERADYPAGAKQVRVLMFIDRFAGDIRRRSESLDP